MVESLYSATRIAAKKDTDGDSVYQAAAEEMKSLKSSFDKPSGNWTLIQDKSAATATLRDKLK
ncbi:hypothetical protein ASD74_02315 [Rhizobium sp. Root564]|nr:hypothetical protein ASD74_02315 [Rhizobium sp. Root564]